LCLLFTAMHSMNKVWRQPRLQLQTKLCLYQTCILSILLYGSETWTLLQEDLRKLEAFQMRCQRMILGIRWHDFVRNTEVVDWTNLPSVRDVIAKRRNSLFCHMVRIDDHTPAHCALSQVVAARTGHRFGPGWRRQPGCPRHSWIQQIGDGIHPSAFVLNGLRLVMATPGWRNGPLLSTRSDDDDDDVHCAFRALHLLVVACRKLCFVKVSVGKPFQGVYNFWKSTGIQLFLLEIFL